MKVTEIGICVEDGDDLEAYVGGWLRSILEAINGEQSNVKGETNG